MKNKERTLAVNLRKQGKTYSEILTQVHVAKSTLAIWLGQVGLAKAQEHRISELKILAQRRGAQARRTSRINISGEIINKAEGEVGKLSKRELWLIGIVLYWAEGSKQKEWNVSQTLQFTNSDPYMVRVYLQWLRKSLRIPKEDICFSLTVHENHKNRLKQIIRHWENVTGFKDHLSDRVYFKRHKPKPGRYNTVENYYGTMRVMVRNSTNLNRMVTGWAQGVYKNCGVV
ncbi:hypothetical protein KW785_02355 [Candidatus Parcubacteria bacterium]|nr:hypothetical protein [Candidatus Parcubacteria bacterium]